MASTSSSTAAPEPLLVLFARGVIARLTLWPALRLAVDQTWGGPESAEKRTWMASVIVDAFDPAESKEEPDDVYVEEILLQTMADEFDAILEDGSAESVAKDITKLWSEIQGSKGKEMVDAWESQVKNSKGKKVAYQEIVDEIAEFDGEEASSDDEDASNDVGTDEDAAPELLESRGLKKDERPEVDEDGFTMVKGKGKSHK